MRRKFLMRISKAILITVIITGGIIVFIDQVFSAARYSDREELESRIINSPQYRNGRFRNSSSDISPLNSKALSSMWEFLFKDNQRTPERVLPVKNADLTHFMSESRNHLSVTWLGHSSLMINIDSYRILTDPVFEKKVSPLGPVRYNGSIPLDTDNLPDIDVVIITHNHYDHLNKYSVQKLKEKSKKFITPLGVGAQLEKWGVSRDKIRELDWWEKYEFDKNLKIYATPSQHFSGRGISDSNRTLWASWVISGPKHRVFASGDSGYFNGFKEIGDKLGPFDMTFIECGAYNEKWHSVHMFPEETVKAHIDLRGKILHPIHWGTFNLSLHSWNEPMRRLYRAAQSEKVKTALPVTGETTVYGEYIPSEKWWEDDYKLKEIKGDKE